MEPTKTIKIASLNYYESKFPGRKLVNLEKLKLIKTLRREGYEVIVLPNDGKPFQYVFTKGVTEILTDPILLYLTGVGTSIVLNLLTNYVSGKLFDKKKVPPVITNINNIIIYPAGTNAQVDYTGQQISAGELQQLKEEITDKKQKFELCFKQKSPYPTLPTPIFRNHQPEIVGWCRFKMDEVGMKVEDGIITHGSVRKEIDEGIYKGFSVAGIAEYSTCSICSENYVNCNHIAGEIYNNQSCTHEIKKSTGIEVSVVYEPTNSQCLLQLK